MSIVIEIENLSKRYQLGAIGTGTLSHDLNRVWAKIRGKEDLSLKIFESDKRSNKSKNQHVWSLKDINLEVKKGEVLGVIGKNGAGKSTLLKLLSRVTAPTTGSIKTKGRITSLLEVGTGFHPELTGKENIYLNGAILGMSKGEITAKLNEIIEFAGISKYAETPVKRYSSGMYVRLAFAVAAHLDSEILIIDEVLAVGDAEFQKKCLGKMNEMSKNSQRTILFVSHDMSAVRELCTRTLLLNNGTVEDCGDTKLMIKKYLHREREGAFSQERIFDIDKQNEFQLLSLRVKDFEGKVSQNHDCDNDISIELDCLVNQETPGLYGYMALMDDEDNIILESDSVDSYNALGNLGIGNFCFEIVIPKRTIGVGRYFIYLNFASIMGSSNFHVYSPGQVGSFNVVDYTTKRGNGRNGYFSTKLEWKPLI